MYEGEAQTRTPKDLKTKMTGKHSAGRGIVRPFHRRFLASDQRRSGKLYQQKVSLRHKPYEPTHGRQAEWYSPAAFVWKTSTCLGRTRRIDPPDRPSAKRCDHLPHLDCILEHKLWHAISRDEPNQSRTDTAPRAGEYRHQCPKPARALTGRVGRPPRHKHRRS